jgi:hypothetical protein
VTPSRRVGCLAGVERRSTRVDHDGGAWVGTGAAYSFAYGAAQGAGFWESVGEGGYEGLTMFLWRELKHDPDMLTGIIVPSESVPANPPPPAATGAG